MKSLLRQTNLLSGFMPVLAFIILLSGFVSYAHAQNPCCVGRAGNVDMDPNDIIDIADMTVLIDHLFISLAPLECPEEANIDGDPNGVIELADLSFLIDHLFISLVETAPCSCIRDTMPTSVQGIWTFQSVTVNGQPASLGETLGWEPGTTSQVLTITQSGNIFVNQLDESSNIVFSEVGTLCITGQTGIVTMTHDSDGPIVPPEITVITWLLSQGNLLITFVEQGIEVQITAAR